MNNEEFNFIHIIITSHCKKSGLVNILQAIHIMIRYFKFKIKGFRKCQSKYIGKLISVKNKVWQKQDPTREKETDLN